ncbi:MAG: YitT family protein, partial [Oscillospiraceae bacterium]|nr:YitT family protein [Oscillospiraceae bacterium]
MKVKIKLKSFLSDTAVFILGGVLYSIAINCFLSKNQILNGGFTGFATVVNFLFGLPIGTVILILNIPLFIISYKKLGMKFVLSSFWATFIISALIDIGDFLPVYRGDLLLASLFGGVLSGAGLGIIFINGATTGGTDIIAKLVGLKYPHISLGKSIFLMDLAIITLGGIVYKNIESSLYAAVVIFVSSQTIDYIIFGVHRSSLILIVTEKGDEMRRLIINDIRRGVTVLKGSGGYTNSEKDVLICACYDNQTGKFIKKIKAFDEKAFL